MVFNRGAPSVISSYEYTAGGSSLGDATDKTGLRYVTSSILEVCLSSLGDYEHIGTDAAGTPYQPKLKAKHVKTMCV